MDMSLCQESRPTNLPMKCFVKKVYGEKHSLRYHWLHRKKLEGIHNVPQVTSGKVEVNLDYLVHKFKNVDVPVCTIDVDDDDLSYQSASPNTIPFQTYVNTYYKTSAKIERKEELTLATEVSPKYFYLKDWHYDIACKAIASAILV